MGKKMTDEMMQGRQGRAQGPDGLLDRAEPQGQARLRDCSTRGSAAVGGPAESCAVIFRAKESFASVSSGNRLGYDFSRAGPNRHGSVLTEAGGGG